MNTPRWVNKAPYYLIALGVALRLAATRFMDIRQDGAAYVAMAHSWAQTRTFTLPYGEVFSRFTSNHEPSHHYSPLFPVLLGEFYRIAGYGLQQSQAFNFLLATATIGLIFLCTRDLYGKGKALWVAAILSVEPGLIVATGTGFTENLILAAFTFTLYCILKSLKNDWWLIGAGIGASASYLTRSGMGMLFIIAGFGGLLWRFYHHGILKTLKAPAYWIAASIFGLTILAWGYRNVHLFGWPNWQTSAYISYVKGIAYAHPLRLAAGLFFKIPLFLAFYAIYYIVYKKELKETLNRIGEEETSGLWLSIGLMFVIGWWLASVFWVAEATPIWWLDNHRYVVVAFLPLLWLAVLVGKTEGRSFQYRSVALAGILTLGSVGLLMEPNRAPEVDAIHYLNPHLEAGSTIGLNGSLAKYVVYAHQVRYDVEVWNCIEGESCQGSPDWILSRKPLEDGNYTLAHKTELPIFFGVTTLDFYTYQRTTP